MRLGDREPHLPILLLYARSVGVSTDILIDDDVNLPSRLQKASKQASGRSKTLPRRKSNR